MRQMAPRWLLSTVLLALCLLAQQGSTAVLCPLPPAADKDSDGPPLTADDIARGVQALGASGALSESQIHQLNELLEDASALRLRVSEQRSHRGQLQVNSAILGSKLLERP